MTTADPTKRKEERRQERGTGARRWEGKGSLTVLSICEQPVLEQDAEPDGKDGDGERGDGEGAPKAGRQRKAGSQSRPVGARSGGRGGNMETYMICM